MKRMLTIRGREAFDDAAKRLHVYIEEKAPAPRGTRVTGTGNSHVHTTEQRFPLQFKSLPTRS